SCLSTFHASNTLYLIIFSLFSFLSFFSFFFFNDPAPTKIYTLSLHDALPIFIVGLILGCFAGNYRNAGRLHRAHGLQDRRPRPEDRKSTRLNSSHVAISYAVFCLKKKKKKYRKKSDA